MNINSACNCCDYAAPPFRLQVRYRQKQVTARFCRTEFRRLWMYQDKGAGQLTPSNPPNPATGTLYSGIGIVYTDLNSSVDEIDPTPIGGFGCFTPISGDLTDNAYATVEEKQDPQQAGGLAIVVIDSLDPNGSPGCSTVCGGPSEPFLIGGGGRYYERNAVSRVNGLDCGMDFSDSEHCNNGGAFVPGGGEFGGGGASGSWGSGSTDPTTSALPSALNNYVTGSTPYMTNQQSRDMAAALRQYEETTGNQLAIVFTPRGASGTYDQFALAEQYGVGQGGGVDSGIVIFVHPESRNWNVATGYGREGDVPDITVNQIMTGAFGPNSSSNIFQATSQAVQGFTGISVNGAAQP